MCLTYFTCVIYAVPTVLGQNTCVSHMDCAVRISYGPSRCTKWADAALFAEPLSMVTVRNPTRNFIAATRDCRQKSGDFKREYLAVALPCICVYVSECVFQILC